MNDTITIPAEMLPVHRENLIQLYCAAFTVSHFNLSREGGGQFPLLRGSVNATHDELEDWRNRYNAWFADLSKEDARALARGLVMSGAV